MCDLVVGIDLDDLDYLGVERFGALVATREAGPKEGEVLPAGRNDERCHVPDTHVDDGPHVRDFGVPSVSYAGADDPPTVVVAHSSATSSAMAAQSRAAKQASESVVHLARCIFQRRPRPTEFVESGQRGIEVLVIE